MLASSFDPSPTGVFVPRSSLERSLADHPRTAKGEERIDSQRLHPLQKIRFQCFRARFCL